MKTFRNKHFENKIFELSNRLTRFDCCTFYNCAFKSKNNTYFNICLDDCVFVKNSCFMIIDGCINNETSDLSITPTEWKGCYMINNKEVLK